MSTKKYKQAKPAKRKVGANSPIPKGWTQVRSGRKRATDKFRSIITGKWVRYQGSSCADLIGEKITSLNFVIRLIPPQRGKEKKS